MEGGKEEVKEEIGEGFGPVLRRVEGRDGEEIGECGGGSEERIEEEEGGSDDLDESDDISSRLEGLRLSGIEPELSEEELRTNDQLQEDELLVLESIYGDKMFILEKQSGLRCFQIHVDVEALSEWTISTNLNPVADEENNTNSSIEFLYSFEAHYLPPIVLTCLLPKSYPSHRPPYFIISIRWLDSSKISLLCSMLDSIWKAQTGQEVIYPWVEWLQSSSLSFLGFDKEIVLGPYGVRHAGDSRALSGCVSPDVDIPLLRRYNDEQKHDKFLRNMQECCICFSEFAGTDFIRLPCQHFFCQKCMKTYCDIHVKEGTVHKLRCPNTKCGGVVPPGILKGLLDDSDFERWETLLLQKTLETMSDVLYCPRCETACIEDEDHHAQCSNCFFSFCTICLDRRHVGTECLNPDARIKILQERQSSTKSGGDSRRRQRNVVNEYLNLKAIFRDSKQCPSCKMAISKIEGCNKMVCQNCGAIFCYRCNQKIDGYEHFSSKDGGCELFVQEDIQNWEAQMNQLQRRVVGRLQDEILVEAEILAGRGHPCPSCLRNNVKVANNNFIRCWACKNHYCYLCRKIITRKFPHFGPKGCKVHTSG